MAVVGLVMFGDAVREEITSSIIDSSSYPAALTYAMCIFIAIVPLTKVPLNARPLVASAEVALGISTARSHDSHHGPSRLAHDQERGRRGTVLAAVARALVRAGILAMIVVIAVLFPAFDSILSLMGSLFCGLISVMYVFTVPKLCFSLVRVI